jgi:AraC-like DNA-binding protein
MPVVPSAEPHPGRLLVQTSSVEEAERRGAQLLSTHRLQVVDKGFDARIHGVSLGPVAIYHMKYGTAVTVMGPPLDGFVAVTLPLRGALMVDHARFRFEATAGQSAAVITPESPMVLRWSPDLEMLCLRIDMSTLQSFARCLTPRADGDAILFHPRMAGRAMACVLGCARLIQLTADQLDHDAAWPPAIATRLREQIMMTLLLGQPNSHRDALTTGRASVARKAVGRAVELVEAEPTLHLTPSALATAMGVSIRALQSGFREVLGTTPHAYIFDVRLRRAHDELLCARSEEGATVTEIARRWGFGNIGRFAEQYHRAYGERPSETLRHS